MVAFPLRAGPYQYRALRKRKIPMIGWDVFALQTGLVGVGHSLPVNGADGVFGSETARAVKALQKEQGLVIDGIAGVATQANIAILLALEAQKAEGLPPGIPLGHVEHESSYLLGNYTAPYTNGSRDCGVVQRNTQYTPMIGGFDTELSIAAIGRHIANYYERYKQLGNSSPTSWRLACGSWNAPSWTDRLARGETLTPEAERHITAYMDAVTKFADL